MLHEAKKYFHFKLDEDGIYGIPKFQDVIHDPKAVQLLKDLETHRLNTLHLLKTQDESVCDRKVAVSVNQTNEKPFQAPVHWISLYGDDKKIVTTDVAEVANILKDGNVLKIFHDAATVVASLHSLGYEVVNYTDVMVMSQVSRHTNRFNKSLNGMAAEYLGVLPQVPELEGNELDMAEDAKQKALQTSQVIDRLHEMLQAEVTEKHLDVVLYREMAAMPAIVELNSNGFAFDYDGWARVLDELEDEANGLETEIHFLLQDDNLNLRSTVSLTDVFRKQGLELKSIDDDCLAKHEEDHEAIRPLRRYLQMRRQLSMFGSAFHSQMDQEGRVHGEWQLVGAETFRMACRRPNLQGLPSKAKAYVHASEGNMLVVADYRTIELRILAELTKDEELLASFRNGDDLHTKTARAILSKSDREVVTDSERDIGKMVNFGLVYGMTPFGLRKKIQAETGEPITQAEAESFRSSFFDKYPGVLRFQDRMLRANMIQTLGGNYWSKMTKELGQGEISRYNFPVQSAGAEGLKEALALVMNEKPADWWLIAVVHDEILLEIPEEDAHEASSWLEDVMKQGMEKFISAVPIEVDCRITPTWR